MSWSERERERERKDNSLIQLYKLNYPEIEMFHWSNLIWLFCMTIWVSADYLATFNLNENAIIHLKYL